MAAKRKIGTSEIEVAPLALGGNVFGWTADEETSFSILDAFVDAGGTMIDTADVYSAWVPGHHGGESEAVIGRWLKRNRSNRSKIVIATKVGMGEGGLAPDRVHRACDASLERLGTDRIDLFYQHKDDEKVPLEDSLGAFNELVQQGKVRAIGLSNFTADRVEAALETAERQGFASPVALQPRYNLVDREDYESSLRAVALQKDLGVLPYYGLASGFLTGKYRSKADLKKSPRGESVSKYLDERGERVLAALDQISMETGCAPATIALAWLMAQPTIVAPLASATSVAQLRELTDAMYLHLDRSHIAMLDEASSVRDEANA